jgi:hypothetical protein
MNAKATPAILRRLDSRSRFSLQLMVETTGPMVAWAISRPHHESFARTFAMQGAHAARLLGLYTPPVQG